MGSLFKKGVQIRSIILAMQIKKSPSSAGVLRFRANRQLVEANRKASKDGPPVASNKDLVEAAAKVKVSKKDPVKPAGSGNVPATEKNGSTSSKTETKPDATKRFSVCYMDIEKNKKAAEEVHIASKKDFLQNFSKSQVSSTTVPENESLIITNGNGNHSTSSSSSDEVQIMKSNNSSSVSASEIRSKRHSVCTMEQQKDHAAENNENTSVRKTSGSLSLVQLRAKKTNKKIAHDTLIEEVPTTSNKDLVEAASKVQVSKKEPVKMTHVSNQEKIPNAAISDETVKRFSICYMEAQNQGDDSVACFRSTGSVSVPTRRASTAVNTASPKISAPRKSSAPEPLQLSMASVSVLETFREEIAESLSAVIVPDVVHRAKFAVIEPSDIKEKAIEIDHPKVTSVARPKAKPKNNCVKHSKCHCVLFSQAVEGFFNVR